MQHKILIRFFLVAALGMVYLTTKSNKTGIFNGGTTCATCHGNASSATTVTLTGLPAQFETGKTYSLTLNITNTTNLKAGFNVLVSAGTLAAGTNSRVNPAKTQITHTSPTSAVGSISSFTFNWTAPANINTVTFNAAGNAVNGNDQDDTGDKWATTTATLGGKFPSGINASNAPTVGCYPNPATTKLTLEGISHTAFISIYTISGQRIPVNYDFFGDQCIINVSELEKGVYFLVASDQNQRYTSRFIKN